MIHYKVFANILPETTVFVHGNLASGAWWEPLRDVFAADKAVASVAAPGHMICLDLPGCGGSSQPQRSSDMNLQKIADDFVALLHGELGDFIHNTASDQKKLSAVHFVGHSAGGLVVALMLALLSSSADSLQSARQTSDIFNADLHNKWRMNKWRMGRALLLDPVGARGLPDDGQLVRLFAKMKSNPALIAKVMAAAIKDIRTEDPFFQARILPDAIKAAEFSGPWLLRALHNIDHRLELKKIANPVLVLHGEDDFILQERDSQDLAALMERGEFRQIPERGHSCNIENPELMATQLREFLYQQNLNDVTLPT